VAFELVQHGCGVSLVDDQYAVEEFAADRVGAEKRVTASQTKLWRPGTFGGQGSVTRLAAGLVGDRYCRVATRRWV
jgi:hypothetical protein